jgi:adenine-specific DNA-methyltransferase
LAKANNDESVVYIENKELLSKGYKTIRPPKKGAGLGRWINLTMKKIMFTLKKLLMVILLLRKFM